MTKTAYVFPGQGSQALNMGMDLLDIPSAKAKFEEAEAILGWSVSEICADEEKLSRTLYTQPCLYVIESILADLLQEKGEKPDLVAGHSLGEYIALYVAGVFDWSTGLQLVKRRAEIMDNTAGGMMAALLNFDREQLEKVIAETPDVVLANDNSPAQVVISGTPEAVQIVMSNVKAKRALPLKVSGAFHSHLMAAASQEFQEILDSIVFQTAEVPVASNVDPVPVTDAEILKQRLTQQMTGSVRWREIALQLPKNGITKVVEIGPGNVLTGLIKRTVEGMELKNIRNTGELPS
ncbi:MAG: ACP S-malonyltransferase [Sphaerospermopsis kisseleviana]|uniref:Malonyl CoA-acyl carrier protein transacylase n=1 Tax=Sphaerospermopsis kisseleviana CS-549 TaxID=3021783 RepID=A0ABT4ZQP0_9CYAN|nr:ACP S-malonyltransferase [Sphaerospermopsis kisseleviana]MDB9441722.1 ACP S-malonyltransferase [Sphaerospermopsis kisseleviana CS-549]BAZ79901.1 malonyl CoA-acyl carrier protein transacylase [Sphaerospermopsis kisseleviana NIES-73]